MFWEWILKYSSFLITGAISLAVGYLLNKIISKNPDLIYYTSHPQAVLLPAPKNPPGNPPQQVAPLPVGTFSLFLSNQGRAAAKNVHIGHYFLPENSVFPDIPRDVVQTPSGGVAIKFPVIPAKTLITVTYFYTGIHSVSNILAYVGSEEMAAKHVPVMLQRVWPKWFNYTVTVLLFAGLWVAVNLVWSLTKFLWHVYYLGH